MNLQRFLYTSVPGIGFVELASDEKIPTRLKEAIRQPQAATVSRGFDAGLGVTYWANTSSVVCTYLERMQDEHRRYFVASHSVCLSPEDYRTMAPHFDDAILTPLKEGISDTPTGGRSLDQLVVVQPSSKESGIRSEDLRILNHYTPEGQRLESLLACLFDGKDITLTIQTDLESEAIKVAVALLKLAATVGVYPQPETGIATFSQSRGIPNLYGSKILPDSRLRIISELSTQGGTFSRKSQAIAQRLIPEILAGNVTGIDRAIRAGDARSRTPSAPPSMPSSSEETSKSRRPATPLASRGSLQPLEPNPIPEIDSKLQEWEHDLTNWQQDLEGREKRLEEWQENLSVEKESLDIERKVLNRQRDELRKASEELTLKETGLGDGGFWQLYVQLDETMQRQDLGNLKGNSIRALETLLIDLRKKLRSRSRSTRIKLLELLAEEDVKRNLSRLSESANLWDKFDELNKEVERQKKSS